MTGAQRESRPQRHQIRVRGRLGQTICSAFPALRAWADGGDTVLTGVLADQAAAGPGPAAPQPCTGTYQAAPEPRIVGHGLQHIQAVLDAQRNGVRAAKIINMRVFTGIPPGRLPVDYLTKA